MLERYGRQEILEAKWESMKGVEGESRTGGGRREEIGTGRRACGLN